MKKNVKLSVPLNEIIEAINTVPITYILKGARVLGCTDYAIRHYYNKNSKLYKDSEKARHAVRKELNNCYIQKNNPISRNRIENFITFLEESGYKFKSERNYEIGGWCNGKRKNNTNYYEL